MKVLVFADSHERLSSMYDIIENHNPNMIIHLGDCVEDIRTVMRSYPNIECNYVCGNNDYYSEAPMSKVAKIGGVTMYLTHGHMERVYGSNVGILPRVARENGASMAFFGHTHRYFNKVVDGIHIINPGSISLPRDGKASCVLMIVENGQVKSLERICD